MIRFVIKNSKEIPLLYPKLAALDELFTISSVENTNYNLQTPFLIVDGVPLDFDRANKYLDSRLKEKENE